MEINYQVNNNNNDNNNNDNNNNKKIIIQYKANKECRIIEK